MDQATQLWGWWWSLLSACALVFTRPGWVRFVPWVTGMVLGGEEPTITPLLTASGLEARWRVLAHVAEDGAWDGAAVARQILRRREQERPARGGGDPPVAVDATKGHRTSTQVWGTGTVHDARARRPQRAETVRAHHGVVMGDVRPGRPWLYWPPAARGSHRRRQLPAGEPCRPQTALAVQLWRQAEAEAVAPLLGGGDGA